MSAPSRYSCQPIADLWTLEAQYARWLLVWQAHSAAIDHPFSAEWSHDDFVHRSLIAEALYGHDLAAALETLRELLKETGQTDAARWLHYGACSSDVVDAGWMLAMKDVSLQLKQLAREVVEEVGRHSDYRWSATKAVMRTHGQAATVAPGQERWTELWSQLFDDLIPALEFSGLVGFNGPTGNSGGLLTFEQRAAIGQQLGMGRRMNARTTQIERRAGWVKWLQAVAALATWCERFGTQVRLLAQTGIDEVTEGRGEEYRGSSSMPHKSNPTRSERLCGLAPVVRGLVNGYAESAASLWDAHSLEHSSAERIVIPQVTELVGFMLTEVADIAETLVVHRVLVERNASVAPADSFEEKNRLVREGADGGEAWLEARQVDAAQRRKRVALEEVTDLMGALRESVDKAKTERTGRDFRRSAPGVTIETPEEDLPPF